MIYCHVSGGWDGSNRDTILVYNPDTEGWSPAGRMREERTHHAVMMINTEMVAQYCQ